MEIDELIRTPLPESRLWRAVSRSLGVAVVLLVVGLLVRAQVVSGQAPASTEQATVPTSFANVHETPGSGSALLVLVPRATVLPLIGRRGEWVQVQLSPELRKTGMVMRWYEGTREITRRGRRITIGDEDSGWMHDSTVEITEASAPSR